MRRVKVEAIFHVRDSDVDVVSDKLLMHMENFRAPGLGANSKQPHFEECSVFVEECRWNKVHKS